MVKYLLNFLFIFLISQSQAQTIEKFYDYKWNECEPGAARFLAVISKTDSGFSRSDFFIHEKTLQMSGKYKDIDCKIQNGYFHYFHSNGIVASVGQYINNKKEGLWLAYHNNGMMSDSANYTNGKPIGINLSWHSNGYNQDSIVTNADGSYVQVSWFDNGVPSSAGIYNNEDKRIGKWFFFHKNGKKSSEEIYTAGKIDEEKFFDENGDLTDKKYVDKEPTFPGGNKAWQEYVFKKSYFPEQYKIVNADKAVVVVTFSIDEEGTVCEVFVSTPFFPQFDKIAEQAIKESPKWSPAVNHNRKVKFTLRQPVTFSQE